jgi:DNA gyrase subunit A
MSQEKEIFEADAKEVEQASVSEQVEQAYIDYAMSVIGGRALPDVRDGLKPVQRRILYKMHEMGVSSGSSHRKSSSIVGETMGDYHPHGDSAIYDSLVRMSQPFSLGIPLVDGQGNFGSMDGDPPAAKRYTEARMSEPAENMLSDIEKDTVNFEANYDNRLEEPAVLPSAIPNLLVNGASGIAVGMTTDIQPHNVGEVIDATTHRIKNPDSDIDDLMDFIKGPDFPTGASIIGRESIERAYKSGKGTITVRSDYEIDRDKNRVIITEIPYQKKKSRLVEKIAEYVENGTLEEVSGVRDESDRNGVRIVIDIKRGSNIDVVENKLIQNVLEETLSMNHIALVDGQPKSLNLAQMIDHYINHRREVVRRRSEYELEEAEDRYHIVNGRLKALQDIDTVVENIRSADDKSSAIENLQEHMDLTEAQASHITRMQLSSLTGLKREELQEEKVELEGTIEELEEILNNAKVLDEKIVEELEEMKKEHNHDRRTSIQTDYQSVENEDLIEQRDVVLVFTRDDYVKRMETDEFSVQNRGGKGVYGLRQAGDEIVDVKVVNSHDELLFFTSEGDVHSKKAYRIPEASRQAHGTNIVNLLGVDNDENIQAIATRPEENEDSYITIATEKGQIKRTELDEYNNIWEPGLKTIELPEEDNIAEAMVTERDDDIMLATAEGQVIRFSSNDVRPTGRTSYGVRGVRMSDEDKVVSATTVSNEDTILTITENGVGKRTKASNYRSQSRDGKGIKAMRDPDGDICAVETVGNDGTLFVSNNGGRIVRMRVDEISLYGRTANGVNIMDLEDDDLVSGVSCCAD